MEKPSWLPYELKSLDEYPQHSSDAPIIGQGTYGSVFVASMPVSETESRLVALKKIMMADGSKNMEGFPRTAIREINLLKELRHDNIVELIDVVGNTAAAAQSQTSPSRSRTLERKGGEDNDDVFLVFEFCDHDLTGLLESNIAFSQAQIKYYMRCILEGLRFCHARRVLHRDVKGANILISNDGRVKIADFGLARHMTESGIYTNRVVTQWYRAPELLLGEDEYDAKIDLWAAGCLFAELLCDGKTLFPGKNTDLDQLTTIYDICGVPDEQSWPKLTKMKLYQQFKPKFAKKSVLREHFAAVPKCSPQALDLLTRLLTYCPESRISASDALKHPYFTKENPPAMQKADHPTYVGNFHEYNSVKRKLKRKRDEEKQKVSSKPTKILKEAIPTLFVAPPKDAYATPDAEMLVKKPGEESPKKATKKDVVDLA